MIQPLEITILGLSITSSWGNGHATTYRGLVRALGARGHHVRFLERDQPWYADNRDLKKLPEAELHIYRDLDELKSLYASAVRRSDLVIVGSYVPDGVLVGRWVCGVAEGVKAFYDIDTPITLAKLKRRDDEYLTPELIRRYDCYLSFTGGRVLRQLEMEYGSPLARPLYCSVDPELYQPEAVEPRYDLGYLGTYSEDRQPPLERLMLDAARGWTAGRFIIAGPQYPETVAWPENVERIEHLPPADHGRFYNSQRFTLNITRAEMIKTGYSPSVRLFEAAACGTPIISDWWEGLETLFRPDREIAISRSAKDTLSWLRGTDEQTRRRMGQAARNRVLSEHTATRRAEELEHIFEEAASRKRVLASPRRPALGQIDPSSAVTIYERPQ